VIDRPEMLVLGRFVSRRVAQESGMVHRAVPEASLDEAGEDLLRTVAARPTISLGLTKWLLHAGAASPRDRQLEHEALGLELSSRSEDFREGQAAFKKKRLPRFQGR
jgi:2-(1,2-epoxy-1,2-dihydrophenyl)acetyl-CoA isomerase